MTKPRLLRQATASATPCWLSEEARLPDSSSRSTLFHFIILSITLSSTFTVGGAQSWLKYS